MERENTALGRKAALEELRIREEERRAAMVAVVEGDDACCVLEVWICVGFAFFYELDPAEPRC